MKAIQLEGFGEIYINPLGIKEKEYDSCDPSGKLVTSKMSGARAKTTWMNSDGIEIPSSQVCKKIVIENEDGTTEDFITPKFTATKEVAKENISILEENSLVYRGLERKFYTVTTDNQQLKDLVMTQNKSLCFPQTLGNGYKFWKSVLTNWKGRMILAACRGDIDNELIKFDEDTVEIEIKEPVAPEKMKKLVMAMIR
jgi:hypothetical protein